MLSRLSPLSPSASTPKRLMLAAMALMLTAPAMLAQDAAPAAPPAGAPPAGAQQQRPRRVPPPGVPEVKKDMADLKITATFEVAGNPDWEVVTPEANWVASSSAKHVVQLLHATNKVGLIVDVNGPCAGLVSAFGSIWSPVCGDRQVVRIDPKTGMITAKIDAWPENSEGGITASPDAVFLSVSNPAKPIPAPRQPRPAGGAAGAPPAGGAPGAGGPGGSGGGQRPPAAPDLPPSLVKIDPKTNTIVGKVELPLTAADPVYADGYVWVSTYNSDSVVKVDPKKMEIVATIPLGEGTKPRFITAGAGFVWVLNQGTGTVSKIETKTTKVVATIQTGLTGSGGDLSYDNGYVWAALFTFPLTKIDAKTDKVVAQWAGPGGDGMRAGLGEVWLSNLQLHTVYRIDGKVQ